MNRSSDYLSEDGVVTRIEGGMAWVNTASKLACSSCAVETSCGNGILEKYLAGKLFISKINNDLDAKVGDSVVIAIPKSQVTKASVIVYVIPIVLLFMGAVLGEFFFASELGAVLIGFTGLAASGVWLANYNRKLASSDQYHPKMVSKKSMYQPSEVFEKIEFKKLDS